MKRNSIENKRENLWILLFLFGLSLALFHILPPFLTRIFLWPLSWGDSLDFLTPFAVIPFAYMLYSRLNRIPQPSPQSESSSKSLNILAKVILATGFISYVEGHGLHLSANSIARLLQEMKDSDLFRAVYLYDEVISHFIWIVGLYLISSGLILFASNLSFKPPIRRSLIFLCLGALFYGLTFMAEAVEGQTVIFAFPAACVNFLVSLVLYLKRAREGRINPVFLFFLLAYLLSVILFSGWGISRGGFPQFSELGWIR